MKKKYIKPKAQIKRFVINEFIANGSAMPTNIIFLGNHEYRY